MGKLPNTLAFPQFSVVCHGDEIRIVYVYVVHIYDNQSYFSFSTYKHTQY